MIKTSYTLCINGYKYKYAHILKVNGKRIYHANTKKTAVTVLISNRADFKAKKLIIDTGTLYNDKVVNSPGRQNNSQNIYDQYSIKLCQLKTDTIAWREVNSLL